MTRAGRLLLVLAYLAFVSLGLPDTVLGVAWPSLRGAFGVSQAGLGVVLGAGVAGYFCSGLIAGRLTQALGVGGLLAGSTSLVAAGLAGYALAPAWSLFVPLAVVIGLGSGAIDAALNGYAARHFSVRHVNWLHACWGLGATLGPAVMTGVLTSGLSYRVGYAVLGGALVAMSLAFTATRRAWRDEADAPAASAHPVNRTSTTAAAGARQTLRLPIVWLQIALFFVYTGLEATAGQWSFTVLRETRGLDVPAAGSWTAAYWGSLLAGRVLLGFVVDRVGPDRLLRLAVLGALAGTGAYALFDGLLSCLGLLLLGASLAPVYPTLMARTPARVGAGAPHAVGFQVSAATLGVAAIPGLLGVWVTSAGPRVVPPVVACLAAALFILHEALLRTSNKAAVDALLPPA